MKRVTITEEAISGINVVPIIDVSLVLLVILLLMGPIMNLPSIPVNLPEAMTKEAKDENLTLSLGSDGTISIDNDVIQWQDLPRMLSTKLRDRKDSVVVIVRADKDLPYGNVENFLRTVNKYVGNRAVAIATSQRPGKLEPAQ